MNGEDVYGRKITVCLPEETPFYNTVRKLAGPLLPKRQESPSPQRRPGRERMNSRSYTPDSYDFVNYNTGPSSFCDKLFGGNDLSLNTYTVNTDYQFKPPNPSTDRKAYKTPGGPVGHEFGRPESPSTSHSATSPSHTHTLPNSNSEKYYNIKSRPPSDPSFTNFGITASSTSTVSSSESQNKLLDPAYFLGGFNKSGAGGGSAPVFKCAEKKSLADIPIPSFGFRDIPPPVMPPNSCCFTLDPNATAFDPIKLIETASKDSSTFMSNSGSTNIEAPPHPDSQPAPLPGPNSYRKNCNKNNFNASQGSAFTKLQTSNGYQNNIKQPYQHQPRSMSVPVQHITIAKERLTIEDEICMMHGYPPASAFRSHSQNAGTFKKPQSPQKAFKVQTNVNGSNLQPSPKNQTAAGNQPNLRHSFSSDGEDRPFSPSNASAAPKQNQSFRPRLASGPTPLFPTNRTPSPYTAPPVNRPRPKQYGSNLYRVPTPDEIGEPSTDYMNPEFNADRDTYVELIVSNLDYNIHPREWRKIIYATFLPHVKILSIQVRLQADNTSVATVRLVSEQDARFAIAQFHRRKIGYKRINVQFKTDVSQSPADSLRADTIALLMEAKDNKMALARLIDLFDKRFHKTVSVSDIYKMRDTIQIVETSGAGRWVKLQPGVRRSPTPTVTADGEVTEVLEQPVCSIHCAEGSVFYTEALNSCMLPSVKMIRKHFSPQLHSLLLSHNGYIPLMSFPACYAAEFKPIEPVADGGIPLEHVISCVPGVEITVSKIGVKVIQFQENREQFYDMMKGSAWQELGKISREVMELLRQQPTCTMPVSRFIPAYHHYFGRQCRVADYGYTKLQELFEAIPHAIQVLGTGDRKAITLSPRAQLKRFTTDILKVVKAQATKQIMLEAFPPAYEKVMGKPLFLPHYGVCFMEDMLMDIPTTTLIVIEENNHTLLALPRRDQTPEEVERTKQFALEVVDLLKHNPQCRMPFNKFIPAYHHHFGRQCRVADYGFTKLGDLFESISHIIELEEEGEEKLIHLSPAELRKVLCEQLTTLIRPSGAIPVNRILTEYANHFGFCLKLDDFRADSTRALLLKLKTHIKIEMRNGQEYASLVRESHIPLIGLQVMQLLMDESGGSLPLMELCMRYESLFGHRCDVDQIRDELSDFMQIDQEDGENGGVIRLTTQQMLARNLRLLLLHKEKILMSDLSSMYKGQYGVDLSPALYGFTSLYHLLQSFPHILELKGKSTQKYIVLSSVLPPPGTLPPARVDVTSPTQFNPSSIQESNGNIDTRSDSTSNLLQHASNLWDSSIVQQSPAGDRQAYNPTSCNIIDLLNSALASSTIAKQDSSKDNLSNGGLSAWQMTAGGETVYSGNVGSHHTSPHPTSNSPYPQACVDSSLVADCETRSQSSADDPKDLFSPANRPLDTSSTNSQPTSSDSCSSSPVKRRTRIAANFKASQC
ncbi:meiosis regulator and mRNA stability factor 1-like isoform X3 [Physella acuta]|nr:meiosis regulator and mRNA stability factor 1-like isoform X3 [Physella acuta]